MYSFISRVLFSTKKIFLDLSWKNINFIYQILGTLYHSCSKKPVCAKNGKLEGGNKIVIHNNCPKMTCWGFSRNMCKSDKAPTSQNGHQHSNNSSASQRIVSVCLNILWFGPKRINKTSCQGHHNNRRGTRFSLLNLYLPGTSFQVF